jgi:hypothetical protein
MGICIFPKLFFFKKTFFGAREPDPNKGNKQGSTTEAAF